MNDQSLQRMENPLPARQEPMDLLAQAVEKGASVETLERMMVVRKQLKEEHAKEAYFAALAAFQAECPVVKKTNRVSIPGGANYNYAPLEIIVLRVAPLLEKHGFAHQEDSEISDGFVKAIVTVTHRLGHSETKTFKVPTESKAGMSPQQKYGAAMTFATRYAFCAAFGIRTGDQDTDCPPQSDGPEVKAGLKAILWGHIKKHFPVSNWDQAQQNLIDENLIEQTENVRDLLNDVSAMRKLVKKLEAR